MTMAMNYVATPTPTHADTVVGTEADARARRDPSLFYWIETKLDQMLVRNSVSVAPGLASGPG